jgi:TM2 domain-containing membrane protein YozV
MALIKCDECGREVSDQALACVGCGAPLRQAHVQAQNYHAPAFQQPIKTAKSRGVYIILGLFLGTLGIHNFYAGYNGRGVVQLLLTLLTGWLIVPWVLVGIWALAEIIAMDRDAAGDKMV